MGRASRRKKTKSKAGSVRIDESFVAGPATVSRAGRYVEIRSRWPTGEHEKFKERVRAERPKLQKRINAAIDQLVEIVTKYDPIPLIRTLYLKNGVLDAESYSEPTFQGSEAYVEYLQSLALAVPEMGSTQPNDAVFDEADNLIAKLFEDVEWYFGLEFTGESRSEWEYRVRYMLILRFLKLRGASFEQHHRELIAGLFGEHDDFLKARVGYTTDEILAAFDEIEAQFTHAIRTQVAATITGKRVHERFREFVDGHPELRSMHDIMREFDPTITEAERLAMRPMFTTQPELLQATELLPNALLDRLSAKPRENHGFLTGKGAGWPLGDSVIYTKPLIHRDGRYYCCNPVLPFRKLDQIIESWIAEDSSYHQHTFTRRRAIFTETEALRHFAALLPGASIIRNAYYNVRDEGEDRRCEADAVVVWDRALFLVEAKASGLDLPSRRGALPGLKEDVRTIVVEAFDQGIRTRTFIESSESVTFENEAGKPVLTVRREDFDDLFIVNVTLESLGFLSSGIHLLKEMGLVDGQAWAWSVFVNDLRVLAEVFETGSDFVAFLRARLRAPEYPQFEVFDELDFLMAYLIDGANLTEVDLGKTDFLNLHGYTVELDRYYAAQSGSVDSGPKPRTKTPATIQRVVEEIEKRADVGFLRATLTLLELDRATMKWLAADVDHSLADTVSTGNRHQSQLTSPGGQSLLTVFSARSWAPHEMNEKLAEVKLRRYDARASRAVSIFVTPGASGPNVASYVVQDEPWRHDTSFEENIARRKRAFIDEYERKRGRPAPNDRCPCGSNKKFKTCCRLL